MVKLSDLRLLRDFQRIVYLNAEVGTVLSALDPRSNQGQGGQDQSQRKPGGQQDQQSPNQGGQQGQKDRDQGVRAAQMPLYAANPYSGMSPVTSMGAACTAS